MWITSEYVFRRCEIFSRISKVHFWNSLKYIHYIQRKEFSSWGKMVVVATWLCVGLGMFSFLQSQKLAKILIFYVNSLESSLFSDRKMQRPRRRNMNCVLSFCRFCQNISEISLASGKNRLFSRKWYFVVTSFISRIRCSHKHESWQKRF